MILCYTDLRLICTFFNPNEVLTGPKAAVKALPHSKVLRGAAMSTYVSFSPRSADLCKARGTHQLTAAHLQLQEHLKAIQHPLTTPQKPHSGPCYTTLSSGQSPVGFSEQPHANPDQTAKHTPAFLLFAQKRWSLVRFSSSVKGLFP